MEEYNHNKNDKTEDIRMVNDFRDELERIKQKLASDFTKYSELDKIKHKEKLNNTNQAKIIYHNKNKETGEKESKYNFYKIPTMEELRIKYGLEPNKKKISETESNISTNTNQNSNIVNNNINNDIINNNNQYNFMKKLEVKKLNINDNNRNNSSNNKLKNAQNFYFNSGLTQNNQNISTIPNDNFMKKYNNLDIDKDVGDKNNLTLKNNNINKYKFKTESNIDDIDKIDNIDNYNYIKKEKRKIESPNRLNSNNNSNNNTSLILNSKLDQQIKLIDEKSENNRLQEEKTQMKIRQIENKLQLDERLTHNNREIRKNALKELIDILQKDFNANEDRQKAFDYFSPWIKFCLEERNSYVIPECLNFFIIFNTLFPNFISNSMKDFFDNVERFISFGILSINESCIKIFLMFFNDKKLYNQTFNEILKLVIKSSSASAKAIKFIQELISILFEKNIVKENFIKILFEKIIQIYSNINIKNNEKKKIFENIIKNIYYYIEDDYENIKKNIKLSSYKDLDILFNKINSSNFKKNIITYNLYPRPIQTEINTNNSNDYFDYNNMNERFMSEKSNSNYKSIYDRNSLNKTPEKKNNNNQINIDGEVNDLISIIPNEFFEYHFVVQFQAKMQILEKTNEILNKIKFVKDKDKNLIDVYKTINYSIEDSNILIHLEGIKILENICRLINEFINKQKLKLILETCFTKLKDKKSITKNELFNLFNIVIEYNCIELNKFISFILNYCSNEKNDNSIIKLGLLEYIKSLFLQKNKKVQRQIYTISEKEYLYFTKIIVNIIEKESLSLIKDLCSDLLIIFKRKINSQRVFYDLIENLPNYRKKIIQTEEKNEMNETKYKKNLRQIKSSYSFSNIKKRNKIKSNTNSNNTSFSNINNNSNSNIKLNNSFKKDIFDSKNNFKKINIRTSYNLKNNTINSIGKLNKKSNTNTNNNKLNISLSTSPQGTTRRKKIENKNENKVINKTEINDNIKDKDNNKVIDKKNIINNNKNKDNSFIERKNTLLKSIENINEDSIEKYSKLIIKDFLVFIKNACKQKNEDLATHFELIFMIYEKIFNRILYIMNENKNIKQNISKFKKLIDELMDYLTKILILAPGIEQIKGSSKFNILLLEKYLSIFKNISFNKEKFYMHILLNLYKLCEGNNDDFPKNFDPKYSTIFYLKYVKRGNTELNSKKILNILKEFIAETNILNLSEKNDLLEGIELHSDEDNNEINNKDNEKEKEKEEYNIIVDKGLKDIPNNNFNYNVNNISNNKKIIKENEIKNISDENLLNKDNNLIINDLAEDENDLDLSLQSDESSKIKKNDFDKIEESIKILSNRLNMTNFATNEKNNKEKIKTENDKNNENNTRKNKVVDNNEIKKNMNALNIPLSLLKNKLSLNNKKNLALKINASNKSNINNSNENINNKNGLVEKEKGNMNNKQNKIKIINNKVPVQNDSKPFVQTLNKIIKALNNESTEEDIFNLAILQFLKLSSIEQKSEYINILQKSLENPIFLKNTSINILLNFYDYILSILSFEILKFPNEESIITKFQALAQYLLNYRKNNDMFKIMLFLLKKYFPKDLNQKIADLSLVMIKIIAFLLKELLKNINKEKINGKEIICEINDLFTNTPPSNLTTLTPNCSFYQNIFTLLKSITDEIVKQDKKELNGIIQYLQQKKIICDDYVQYLIRLNKTF